MNTASNDSNSLGTSGDNDSKDSHGNPEKEWFYDEMDMSHVDDFEEDFESDMDFDESYTKKKRRGRIPKKPPVERGEGTPKRGRGGGRGNLFYVFLLLISFCLGLVQVVSYFVIFLVI